MPEINLKLKNFTFLDGINNFENKTDNFKLHW